MNERNDVLAVMDAEIAHMGSLTSYRDRPAQARAQADMREARAAVAELIEQQKRDAQLVAVLLSYLNDNLTEREKGRLGTELMARDLSEHDERRRAALARVGGA